jgi:hypothetical protein
VLQAATPWFCIPSQQYLHLLALLSLPIHDSGEKERKKKATTSRKLKIPFSHNIMCEKNHGFIIYSPPRNLPFEIDIKCSLFGKCYTYYCQQFERQ